jgi:hypothetical protein
VPQGGQVPQVPQQVPLPSSAQGQGNAQHPAPVSQVLGDSRL